MIQFHRRLRPVQVISFDLDDTLYDNGPVMQRAEQALVDYLHQQYPQTQSLAVKDWRALRDRVAASDPDLATNMTALRLTTLEQGLVASGVAIASSRQASEDAMAEFLSYRNRVDVAAEVHQLLAALSQRFALIAVSNGNADIAEMGLGSYFSHAWQPTAALRGKPTTDMFEAARRALGFAPGELLHIGDHPVSDVQGAARFGAQSVWLNESGRPHPQLTWLPSVTITHLPALHEIV